jgi:acetyl-CoA carboxylase biotin carboxyl carrier protein
MTDLTHDDVQKILKIIDEMGDRDVHLEMGDFKLHVSRSSAALPVSRAAPAAPVTPAAEIIAQPAAVSPPGEATASNVPASVNIPAGHVAICAPTMGTFYRASSPGAPPHTEVGNRVGPDDAVGVFEVMKLFTTLKAGVAGTVTLIAAANEAMVQQDQVLVVIRPD